MEKNTITNKVANKKSIFQHNKLLLKNHKLKQKITQKFVFQFSRSDCTEIWNANTNDRNKKIIARLNGLSLSDKTEAAMKTMGKERLVFRIFSFIRRKERTARRYCVAGLHMRGSWITSWCRARVKEEKKGENVLKGYKRADRDRKLIKCGLPRLCCHATGLGTGLV